jgi:hypothetical protein
VTCQCKYAKGNGTLLMVELVRDDFGCLIPKIPSQDAFSSSLSTFSMPILPATVKLCANIIFRDHLAKREVYPRRRAVHMIPARDTKTDNDINAFAQKQLFSRI